MEKLTERRSTSLAKSETVRLAELATAEQRSEAWIIRRALLYYLASHLSQKGEQEQ